MVQWLCIRNPADTTSEPLTGNGQTGAPVKAPMSDGESRNQGGTVEYICIPPLFRQGMGLFLCPPQGFFEMGGRRGVADCKDYHVIPRANGPWESPGTI